MHLNFTIKSSFFDEIKYWGNFWKQFRYSVFPADIINHSKHQHNATQTQTTLCVGNLLVPEKLSEIPVRAQTRHLQYSKN